MVPAGVEAAVSVEVTRYLRFDVVDPNPGPAALHQRIEALFDPYGILNPGQAL